MPIYEYQCETCQHTVDALQKVDDRPLVDCPQCGEPALRRLLSAPRFRLKGTGWYETDFKQQDRRNLASDDGKPAKKTDDTDGAANKAEPKKKDSPSEKKSEP